MNNFSHTQHLTIALSVIRATLILALSPITILLISSVLASAYFHVLNYKNCINLYKNLFKEKKLFLGINFIVALMWFATYYSIYYSSATIFVFEFFMMGGLLSIMFRRVNRNQKRVVLFFLGLVLAPLMIYPLQYKGVLLGVIAGSCGFLYNILSDKVASTLNIKASQILASRFWLLILLSMYLLPNNFSTQLSVYTVSIAILITVLSFILQIWLNQQSVLTIGGKESSYISSLAPILTFLVQRTVLGNWVYPMLLLSVIGSICIVYDSYVRDNSTQGGRFFSRLTLTQK